MLALQAQLDAIHREHAVDGKMPAHVAQEVDVIEPGQPVGVVEQPRFALSVAEAQELGEGFLNRGLVGVDLVDREQLAAFVLAEGSPTRVVPPPTSGKGLPPLRCSQESSMIEMRLPDVQRRRGAVEADIGREAALRAKLRRAPHYRCIGGRIRVRRASRETRIWGRRRRSWAVVSGKPAGAQGRGA